MYELEKGEFKEPVMGERAKSYEQERPGGVTFLAVLNIIGAVIIGVIGLVSLQYLQFPNTGLAVLYSGITVSLATFSTVVSIGLLRLKNWARIIAIISYLVSALAGLISLATGNLSGLFQIAVATTVVIYLNRQHVRQAFGVY